MTGEGAAPAHRSSPTAAHLLRAAEGLFARDGLRRTSMVDVALAAGVSRRTLYNHFESKSDLVTAFVERQARRAYAAAAAMVDQAGPTETLLVEAELALLRASTSPRYVAILLEPDAWAITSEVIRGSEAIRTLARDYWTPYLDVLDAAGRLRPDLDRDLAVEWLELLHLLVVAHPELLGGADRVREIYTSFVVPALVVGPGS